MNILMVSFDFPPTVGGIAAHVFELSKALCRQGHRVSVVSRRLKYENSTVSTLEGITVYRMKLRGIAPLYGWQTNRYIERLLSRVQPDIIHIHGMAPLEGYTVKSAPLVYTNHTSGYLKRIQKGGIRRMALIKRLFKKPRLFLAPSRELLEVPFPIPAEKIFIPNGVDAAKYRYNEDHRRQVRTQLGLEDDDIVGILTRRLVEKNGVIHLAGATEFVRHRRVKLVLIGDGPEYQKIEAVLKRHFAGRYFLLGAKTHAEIIPYYSAADFSILPSLMEATSISGLEAMAASLPLVGTAVGGIPDLIKAGENGFLCRPADAKDLSRKIDKLLGCDLKACGSRSRRMVEAEFSWSQIAQKTQAAYEGIL